MQIAWQWGSLNGLVSLSVILLKGLKNLFLSLERGYIHSCVCELF